MREGGSSATVEASEGRSGTVGNLIERDIRKLEDELQLGQYVRGRVEPVHLAQPHFAADRAD
jgi:hypothetical protein